jgi:hypothetical protein
LAVGAPLLRSEDVQERADVGVSATIPGQSMDVKSLFVSILHD